MKKLFCFILLSFCFVCSLTAAQKKFNVMLLQSNDVLNERCPDVQDMVKYINNITEELSKSSLSGEGFIIIAVRPFYKSNVWFDFKKEDKNKLKELKENILTIEPCYVQGGVVVFALTNLDHPESVQMLPEEWKDAASRKENKNLEVSEFIDVIWPPQITDEEKEYFLSLINAFKKETDFSDESLQKYNSLIDFAVESDTLKITISSKYWPEDVADSKYSSLFLIAYIAGNMENQLIKNKYINSPQQGLELEKMKYKQLKQIDKSVKFSSLE